MRLIVRFSRVCSVGVVALALGVGGGCGGDPNESDEIEGQAPPNAPTTQAEFAKQQQEKMQGEAQADQ